MGILDLLLGQLLQKIVPQDALRALIEDVKREIQKFQAQHPGVLSVQVGLLQQFLEAKLAPYLDVTRISRTLNGIAHDIIAGTAGVDVDAWGGGF